MSEEAEFKSMRITLSEEAFDRLEKIMKDAKFRSYSSTVEESIRAISDIMSDIYNIAGKRDDPRKTVTDNMRRTLFNQIITRMGRFTGRTVAPKEPSK